MTLPSVLSAIDLPAAELYAARLDGELFPVGGAFLAVDEIEQPRHRVTAALAGLQDRLIAERLSAAWVWGALDAAPARHQFCVGIGSRVAHSPARWMTVREVVIGADEIADLEGGLVTSPLRTVVDLVRFGDRFDDAEAGIVRRLAELDGAGLEHAALAIEGRRNLPGKRRALARLRQCGLP